MAIEQSKVSPAQRAQNFAQATRQNLQSLPSVAGAEDSVVQISIPKVRLHSKTMLMVEATLTATHASNVTYTPATFAPFSLLRRIQVDINNGFSPFSIDGIDAYLMNFLENNAGAVMGRAASGRTPNIMPLVASSGGTANSIRFMVDLTSVINARDPVGLILLQNEETVVTITLNIGNKGHVAPAASGYTFALSNITITPVVETFSVPAVSNALPDISILKLVQSQTEAVAGAGSKSVKLLTGNTYRKLLVYLTDSSDVGLADTAITGDLELVFNQADSPYRINPKVLAMMNSKMYGAALPTGVYAFDFSYQGIPGLGGTRDYIDTERLAEFWFRFTAPGAGNVKVISETLTKLRGLS